MKLDNKFITATNKDIIIDMINHCIKPSEIANFFGFDDLKPFRQELIDNDIPTYIRANADYRQELRNSHIMKHVKLLVQNKTDFDSYINADISRDDLLKKYYIPFSEYDYFINCVATELNKDLAKLNDEITANHRDKGLFTSGFQKGSVNRRHFEKTMQEKYGVKSVFADGELRDKILNDRLERIGVKLTSQVTKYDKIVANLKANPVIAKQFKIKLTSNQVANRRQVFDLLNVSQSKDKDVKRFENMKHLFTIYKNNTGIITQYPNNELFDIFELNKILTRNVAKQLSNIGLIDFNTKSSKISRYEAKIIRILDEMNVKYQLNNRSILVDPSKPSNGQEIDIYLTDYNIGIEVNPAYSHNSNKYRVPKFKKDDRVFLSKPKSYHLNKFKLAKEKNVQLIQLFEWNLTTNFLNNHFKPYIEFLVNENITKIYARNISFQLCTNEKLKKQARDFITQNHRSGNVPAKYYMLVKTSDNNIVAAMSFVNVRNHSSRLELKRLAVKQNVQIIGLTSKLAKHIFEFFPDYNELLSYSDNNFGFGKSYEKAGFEFIGYTNPSEIFVSTTSGDDTYSWQINTPWGANNESGVVYKDCQRKGLNINDFDSVQEYIELELSHKIGKSKGYDLVCDAGSSRWLLKK